MEQIVDFIPFNNRQAIVFDIDDTLLNTHTLQLIPNIYSFYRYCLQKGYTIFIITARVGTPVNIKATAHQLENLGIRDYKSIYFRQPYDIDMHSFKENSRKNILNEGHKVIMSLGDNIWDIGKYGGVGVLVKDKGERLFFSNLRSDS